MLTYQSLAEWKSIMPFLALVVSLLMQTATPPEHRVSCVDQNLSEVALAACLDKEVVEVDSELNRTYKATHASLPPDQQNLLRASERAWIRCRDSDLALFESFVRGNHPSIVVQTEQVRVIRERIKLLQGYRA